MEKDIKKHGAEFALEMYQQGFEEGMQEMIKILESTDSEEIWDVIYSHKKI